MPWELGRDGPFYWEYAKDKTPSYGGGNNGSEAPMTGKPAMYYTHGDGAVECLGGEPDHDLMRKLSQEKVASLPATHGQMEKVIEALNRIEALLQKSDEN